MATNPFDLGGLLFGGGDNGLNEYLNDKQREAIQRQAMFQAAAALLQAGGPSTQRISFGQALGGALQAGSKGYVDAQQSAINQLLTKQKMDEYKIAQDQRRRLEQIFGVAAPTAGMPMTPDQALAAPGGQVGPTVGRAAMIGQTPEATAMSPEDMRYDQYMKAAQLFAADPTKSKAYMDMAMAIKPKTEVTGDIFTAKDGKQYQRTKTGQFVPIPTGMEFAQETVGEPFKAADGKFYLRTKTGGFVPAEQGLAAKPMGQPQQVMGADGKPTLVQMYDDGTYKPVSGVSPLIPPEKIDTGGGVRFVNPYEVKPGTVFPKTLPPQVVGSAEGGYFAIGGGGGGVRGGMPTAPAPAPAAASAPSRTGPPMPGAAAAAPAGPQPIIPGTGKAFANEKDLRTEFSAQVKPYTELAQAFRKVEAAALNPSAAGDISLVYGYMKILDPGSTVMQGEQATAQNAGSVPDSVRAMYNKALTGESLAPTIRQDFYAQARNIIESQRELSSDLIQRYTGVAREYKLNPNQIVYDPFKRIKTPTEVAAEALKNQGKPKTNTTYTNQYGLTPRSK
jgi:hypothetical protein